MNGDMHQPELDELGKHKERMNQVRRNTLANEAKFRKDAWCNQVEMSYNSNDLMNCKFLFILRRHLEQFFISYFEIFIQISNFFSLIFSNDGWCFRHSETCITPQFQEQIKIY